MSSISTLAAKWFHLGVALGLSADTLAQIACDHQGDACSRLTAMVIAWLQKKDNVQPSWRELVVALNSSLVNRIDIATIIAAERRRSC